VNPNTSHPKQGVSTRRPRGGPLHHKPDAVVYAREVKGFTQGAFAKALMINQGYLSRIERGERNAPPELLTRMAAILGCPVSVLRNMP
jgi:ribosome-binding protein aMBF1 (putative translation factor)